MGVVFVPSLLRYVQFASVSSSSVHFGGRMATVTRLRSRGGVSRRRYLGLLLSFQQGRLYVGQAGCYDVAKMGGARTVLRLGSFVRGKVVRECKDEGTMMCVREWG